MPVELRKRKTPPPAPASAPKKSKASNKGAASKITEAKEAVTKKIKGSSKKPEAVQASAAAAEVPDANGKAQPAEAKPVETKAAATSPPKVGDVITLDGFGDEVETNEGVKVTLKQLLEESKAGVVLFTYPKASTPGCTTQVCLFRDSYTPLTATGLSIFGLSNDSPKANTNFKTKQKLPYPLLCNPSGSLIKAIGLGKAGNKTTRGVFVVDKSGKVLAVEAGGPAPTVEVVKKVVAAMGGNPEEVKGPNVDKAKEDKDQADTAAQVADTAAALDA